MDFAEKSLPLCREFGVECVSSPMRPRTIVDYDRSRGSWMKEPSRLSTFDSDVRAVIGSFDILIRPCWSRCTGTENFDHEVKFTERFRRS